MFARWVRAWKSGAYVGAPISATWRRLTGARPLSEAENAAADHVGQGFFSPFAKKLKGKKTQTQGKFSQNSRIFCPKTQETGNFRVKFKILVQILPIFDQKSENFPKTQGFS